LCVPGVLLSGILFLADIPLAVLRVPAADELPHLTYRIPPV